MMKKILHSVLVASFLLSVFALPTEVGATTLQDYIDKVNKYQAEVDSANAEVQKTDAEIRAIKGEISTLQNEIQSMMEEAEQKQQEIEQFNQDIKQKSLETKDLFQYLQIADGENAYLEYAFGATDITDMIYRMSLVEQMTEYNDNTIHELEGMIEENKKKKKELEKGQKEMEEKKVLLGQKISSLEGQKVSIQSGAISSSKQLKIYQDTVKMYQNLGCGASDVIGVTCAVNQTVPTAGWYRPLENGRISSYMGYRDFSAAGSNFHQGIDLTSPSGRGTYIYPIAPGTIGYVGQDYYGANLVVVYHVGPDGRNYSSLYVHMDWVSGGLYKGRIVDQNTVLGGMGDTGWAYGVHLHLEVADCRLYDPMDGQCATWNSWSNYIMRRYNNGFKGAQSLLNLPTSWYGR